MDRTLLFGDVLGRVGTRVLLFIGGIVLPALVVTGYVGMVVLVVVPLFLLRLVFPHSRPVWNRGGWRRLPRPVSP